MHKPEKTMRDAVIYSTVAFGFSLFAWVYGCYNGKLELFIAASFPPMVIAIVLLARAKGPVKRESEEQ